MVAIPKLMLLSGDFQVPIGQVWSCAIGLAGFKQSLREMAGGTDPDLGDWMDHPLLREFFAAAARDPFSLATDWIWTEQIATSVEQAAAKAPLCFRFPVLGIGWQMHRDLLLAKLPLNVRHQFEKYERGAQRATFLPSTAYMGGAHLAKLADVAHWRRPGRTGWRVSMTLASFIDTPCDPVGHDGYMHFVIKDEDVCYSMPALGLLNNKRTSKSSLRMLLWKLMMSLPPIFSVQSHNGLLRRVAPTLLRRALRRPPGLSSRVCRTRLL